MESSGTLNIPSSDNDPHQAAAARARIEALSDVYHGNKPLWDAAAPTNPSAASTAVSTATASAKSIGLKAGQYAKAKLPSRKKPIFAAFAGFILMFLAFKSPLIISEIKYLNSAKTPPAPVVNPASIAEPAPPEYTITIPKINVTSPVIYEASYSEVAIQKALQNGVVQYANTAPPGTPGNTVIVGHSSNDWWQPGNFKFIFVLLDKLAVGDRFSINYESKKYVYEVTTISIVEPTDLSVLLPTGEPTVTLITCTPPGTSWRRLIVKAKQISPVPQAIQPHRSTNPEGVALPGNAPRLTEQIKRLWQNLVSGIND